jgi:hypothetical protein
MRDKTFLLTLFLIAIVCTLTLAACSRPLI